VRTQEVECEWVGFVTVHNTYLIILGLVGGIRNALPRANVTFEMGFRRSMDVISANS
jgi:hypothetical protein